MPLPMDSLLQERYRIVRSIRSGGMGAVYEARDTKLADSPCAVKEILDSARLGKDSDYMQERFREEMGNLARLDHPSIPKVRDYLTVNSTIYIVMDLIQGRSLDLEAEETLRVTGSPPAPEKCVQDIIQLLDTLTYLHSQEPPIVHRDVKPANILRDTRNGMIKLVDFGLARKLDKTSGQTIVGTLGYCPPEQMMGKAETASDIFSVGVSLHHLLTGQPPEMINFEPLRPDGVPTALADIVEKATQMKPADRYGSAQEMAAALKKWLERASARPWAVAAAPPVSSRPDPVLSVKAPLPTTPRETEGVVPSSQLAAPETQLLPPSRIPTLAAVGVAALGGALVMGLFMGRGSSPAPTSTPVAVRTAAVAPPQAPPSPLLETPSPVVVVASPPAPPPVGKPPAAPVKPPHVEKPPVARQQPPVQPPAHPPQQVVHRPPAVEMPKLGEAPAYPTAPAETPHPKRQPVVEPPVIHPQEHPVTRPGLRWAKNHPEFLRKHNPVLNQQRPWQQHKRPMNPRFNPI